MLVKRALKYLLAGSSVSILILLYCGYQGSLDHGMDTWKDEVRNPIDLLIEDNGEDSGWETQEDYLSDNVATATTNQPRTRPTPFNSKPVGMERASNESSPLKTILFWNPWYHMADYGFGLSREPFIKHGCSENRCTAASDPSELAQRADAVVICGRLLNWDLDEVVLPRTDTKQVYVYFNNEGPVKTIGRTRRLANTFNATMTHRLDSTIPFPYSEIVPRIDKTDFRPVTKHDIREKSSTHLVSWMVSRCNKPGCVRHEYAAALAEHMPVDVYGRCGNLTCDRYDNGTCMDYQERRYRFYLAFENTVCADYVTEKAFRTLRYNIVPVVMGGANYTRILPPHSFIDIRDYETPRHLSDYLKYLAQHDEEYLKYFEWKRDYEVRDLTIAEPMCKLCDLLHNPDKYELEENFDLEDWWEDQAGEACVDNRKLNLLYAYFGIEPPAEPRRRGRGPKAKTRAWAGAAKS